MTKYVLFKHEDILPDNEVFAYMILLLILSIVHMVFTGLLIFPEKMYTVPTKLYPVRTGLSTILLKFGPAVLAIVIIWLVLNVVANWKLLKKAGRSGFQSIIPVWCTISRFGISWSKLAGIGYLVCISIAALNVQGLSQLGQVIYYIAVFTGFLLNLIEKFKLSKSFGHGFGFGLGLLVFEPVFVMVLAFGKSRYVKYKRKR